MDVSPDAEAEACVSRGHSQGLAYYRQPGGTNSPYGASVISWPRCDFRFQILRFERDWIAIYEHAGVSFPIRASGDDEFNPAGFLSRWRDCWDRMHEMQRAPGRNDGDCVRRGDLAERVRNRFRWNFVCRSTRATWEHSEPRWLPSFESSCFLFVCSETRWRGHTWRSEQKLWKQQELRLGSKERVRVDSVVQLTLQFYRDLHNCSGRSHRLLTFIALLRANKVESDSIVLDLYWL